jgi:hypothetical protein
MAATQSQVRPPDAGTRAGDGWLSYAGILVMIGGILNVIWGIAAIGKSDFFVGDARYVISELNVWGWVALVLGVLLLFAAFGIFNGRSWAIWTGVICLSLNAVAQMLSIPAYPLWALALLALDMLAIYGLIVHGAFRPD